MLKFNELPFGQKITIAIISLLIVACAILLIISSFFVEGSIRNEKKIQLNYLGDIGIQVLTYYHNLETAGKLTREDAQKAAKTTIKAMKYGKRSLDYFWINDFTPKMVLHPMKPELDGKDLSNIVDPDGVHLFLEFVKICKEQHTGYFHYKWQYYDDRQRIEPKLSYVAEFKPWNWIIGTGVYLDDVKVAINKVRSIMLVTMILAVCFVGIMAAMVSHAVVKPIRSTTAMIKDISDGHGDLTKQLNITSRDEIGEMAQHFNRFILKFRSLVDDITTTAVKVTDSTMTLSNSAMIVASNTEKINTQTKNVVAATEQATMNIQAISAAAEQMSSSANTVATSIEEMSASLDEVSRSCQKELKIASEANDNAITSKEVINKLGNVAKSIGKVTDVINDISAQTNLLALNATIEAASAGEAGKGFSVVASEVKGLAGKTAEATQEIEVQIETIQSSTASAVTAIDTVTKIIEEVNIISQTIASSVEEQSAVINEIARNVSGVNDGANEVARNVSESAAGLNEVTGTISSVSKAVAETVSGIEQIRRDVDEVAVLSENLKVLMNQFRI